MIPCSFLTGHPWILFYTAPSLKNLAKPIKSHLTVRTRIEQERRNLAFSSLSDDFGSTLTSGSSSKMPESEDSGFIDALTMAVSHMKISEPKRSRICSPARTINQECSSNIQSNHLCTAFWRVSPAAACSSSPCKGITLKQRWSTACCVNHWLIYQLHEVATGEPLSFNLWLE